jgi:hypothetical protein
MSLFLTLLNKFYVQINFDAFPLNLPLEYFGAGNNWAGLPDNPMIQPHSIKVKLWINKGSLFIGKYLSKDLLTTLRRGRESNPSDTRNKKNI